MLMNVDLLFGPLHFQAKDKSKFFLIFFFTSFLVLNKVTLTERIFFRDEAKNAFFKKERRTKHVFNIFKKNALFPEHENELKRKGLLCSTVHEKWNWI